MITTPEAVGETQPWTAADGTVVTFDGRLDNRDDLIAALGLPPALPDVEIAGAAYLRWGVELPPRLLGDYALAVWDHREQRLFAARDEIGFRSLYYRVSDREFSWASETKPLTAGVPFLPNEGYIAECLAARIVSRTETLYAGVQQLAPAHAMTVARNGAVRIWSYWRPDTERSSRRDPRDFADELRATLRDALRARLRLHGDATLALSGGLDSSAIAALIAGLREDGLDAAGRVSAVTVGVPHPSDETRRARATAEWLRIPWQAAESRLTFRAADLMDEARRMRSLPVPPNTRSAVALREQARARGHRVLFYGIGAGDWLDGSYWDFAELIARGRMRSAAQWLAYEWHIREHTPLIGQLWLAAWAVVPGGLKGALRQRLHRSPVPAWIAPAFARRVDLDQRLRRGDPDPDIHPLAARGVLWFANSGDTKALLAELERLHAYAGLELRCPFYDRRVIELLLTTPPEVRSSGGVPKAVLRNAMAAGLPAAVTGARPDRDGNWIAGRAFNQLAPAAGVRRLLPVTNGWIEGDRLAAMRAAGVGERTPFVWPLWAAIAIDFWLRAESEHGLSAQGDTEWSTSSGTRRHEPRSLIGSAGATRVPN
jgi:asparagine synthase (glutamine-hydrolysing)